MTQINVNIDSNVFNPVYLPYLTEQARTEIFFGGSSSGKSVFLSDRAIFDLMGGERNYLIVRNTGNTLRTSTFNELQKSITRWGVGDLFNINKSDMVITCANKKQALFKGLDDVEKIKSITPIDGVITDIWIEEATETKEEDIKQLSKRLRGKSKAKKRLTYSFNPILRSHWICKKYFGGWQDGDKEYRDENLIILKTTYKDNKFLEVDDIYELENETDEYYFNVYTLGNWGVLGDLIFKNWHVEDLTDQIPHFDNIRNGLDFGFSNDPTAYNRMHFDRMRKKIYIFRELHEFGKTNPDLAVLLKPIIGDETITCDSAEPKSIQELNDNGINAYGAEKGKDSVMFGIQWLQQHEIIIDRSCQHTINEFQTYHWMKNKDGEALNKPVDRYNHHIDGIRYGLEEDMRNITADIQATCESEAAQGDW